MIPKEPRSRHARRSRSSPAQKPKRGRRSGKNAGAASRERILDAGEELFAAHGFDGVTVREVARKAKVDVALAHYYFGTKRGLFDAVFFRRAKVLNDDRLQSMNDYQISHGSGRATVAGLTQAFLEPIIKRWATGGRGWKNYLAIIAQVNNTPRWGGETMGVYFDSIIHRYIDALRGLMPGARDEDIYWCYQFFSGALTLTFAETGRLDRLSSGVCRSSDAEAVRARLAPFIAAGFAAICQRKSR